MTNPAKPMTEIVKARPLAPTASAECSQALWRQLTDDRVGFGEAVEELRALAVDLPGFRQEIANAAEQLQRHAEPCGAKAVIATLVPLVTLYGMADRSEAEWRTFWGFYVKALGELPGEALRKGVDEYVSDPKSEFFPRPGPLKAICEKHAIPIRMAMSRARKTAQHLTSGAAA